MEAVATLLKAETLNEFAGRHGDDLYDVLALLDAAAQRIDAAMPVTADGEASHNTLRLVQMAAERVKVVADLLLEVR